MWITNVIYTLTFILIIYGLKYYFNNIKSKIFLPSSFIDNEEIKNFKLFFLENLNDNEIGIYLKYFNKYTILTKPKTIFREINYYLYHLTNNFYGVITSNEDFYIIEIYKEEVDISSLEKEYNIIVFENKDFKYLIVKNQKDKIEKEYFYNIEKEEFYRISLLITLPHKGIQYYLKSNGKIIKNNIIKNLEKDLNER